MSIKTVRTICFECHSRCGVLLEVENGKIVGIEGDKDHPFSHGYTCPKGLAVREIIYHPDRITHPLRRVGERGEGKFEKISWNNAFDIISKRLLETRDQYGAESVVFGGGTTRGFRPWIFRFSGLFGTPNYYGPVNYSGGPLALGFGSVCSIGSFPPDFANSKCIVLWAHNPEQSLPGLFMYDINQALNSGAKLIVIDPRGTSLAKKADYWLPVRPGTDVALALCFIHVIIENDLYDKEFVDKWTEGFDQLREHVSSFTPDRVAEITWIPADKIKQAAFTFAKTKPACLTPGIGGACQSTNSFDLNRALMILIVITGNLDIVGGNLETRSPLGPRSIYGSDLALSGSVSRKQWQKKLGTKRYPLLSMVNSLLPPEMVWQAILEQKPYPVKAMGIFANNAMCSFANSAQIKKALNALDFLFVVDYFHTPTTEMADVVLPPAHWTERDDIEDLMMKNWVFCQPKAVEPIPDCRSEAHILIALAEKMGFQDFWKTTEEHFNYRLEPIGMTFEEFKKVGKFAGPVVENRYVKEGKFPSPSGKIEIYGKRLEPLGIAPLPSFKEPPESPISTPELFQDYPLVLTTGGRNIVYYHSGLRNIPSLRKLSPDPELQIHPKTAEQLKVGDGEWVYLVSARGRVEIKTRYFEDIHPKVVNAPHGYWYGVKDGWKKLNINMITDNQQTDPVTASCPIRGLLCRIEKMN